MAHSAPKRSCAQLFGAIDPTANGDLITYCTIGGRASTAWFVLTYLLGRDQRPGVRRLVGRMGPTADHAGGERKLIAPTHRVPPTPAHPAAPGDSRRLRLSHSCCTPAVHVDRLY